MARALLTEMARLNLKNAISITPLTFLCPTVEACLKRKAR